MVRNIERRNYAEVLRKRGFSFSKISKSLGGIPKGTLSYWLKDVKLSSPQKEKLRKENLLHLIRARERALTVNRERRKIYFAGIRSQYIGLYNKLKDEDTALISLGLLYLAEGTKYEKGTLVFGNSNPNIIRLFLRLLRFCYKIDETKFRCTIQGRSDQDFPKLQRFWRRVTGVPPKQFYAPRVDPRSRGKQTMRAEYKGVCRIDYLSASTFHKVLSIGKVLTEPQ
ncbi:MAG: hypothetical protein AAB561_02210 [Patescibacteria group bacterium]